MAAAPRTMVVGVVALAALGLTPGVAQPDAVPPLHLACAGHGLGMPCLGDTPDAPSAPAWRETLRRAYGAPAPMMAHDREPFRTAIACTDTRAELRAEPAAPGTLEVQLVVESGRWEMRKTASLGGHRYEAQSDASTWIWVRDDSVALSVNGRMLPSCTASGVPKPSRARAPASWPPADRLVNAPPATAAPQP